MIQQGHTTRSLGKAGILCVTGAVVLLPLALSRAQQSERTAREAPASTTQPTGEDHIDPVLRAQLDRQLPQVEFNGVGLTDVIDFLRDVSGANIVVNWKDLEAAGIDRNSPVTVKLRNIKFSKALSVILDSLFLSNAKQGSLLWRADGNILTILSTGDAGKVIRRTYDVHDLAAEGGKADSLVRMITGSIDAGSWKDNGGTTGTIKFEGGKLVITQTQANQEAVANLLARARELFKNGR